MQGLHIQVRQVFQQVVVQVEDDELSSFAVPGVYESLASIFGFEVDIADCMIATLYDLNVVGVLLPTLVADADVLSDVWYALCFAMYFDHDVYLANM
jgi:hypothetical protein